MTELAGFTAAGSVIGSIMSITADSLLLASVFKLFAHLFIRAICRRFEIGKFYLPMVNQP